MTATDNTDLHSIKKKLDSIQREVGLLKDQNKKLSEENKRLREQISDIQKGQMDIFQTLTEKDRIALRQQIMRYIEKIDSYLQPETKSS